MRMSRKKKGEKNICPKICPCEGKGDEEELSQSKKKSCDHERKKEAFFLALLLVDSPRSLLALLAAFYHENDARKRKYSSRIREPASPPTFPNRRFTQKLKQKKTNCKKMRPILLTFFLNSTSFFPNHIPSYCYIKKLTNLAKRLQQKCPCAKCSLRCTAAAS